MLTIRCKKELVYAYQHLHIMQELCKQFGINDKAKAAMDEIKRDIRRYNNQPLEDGRVIKEYGIDGVLILQPLPARLSSLEAAIEYFEECEYIHSRPSAYDCTGQLFTAWYKVIERGGRFWAYHDIGRDV